MNPSRRSAILATLMGNSASTVIVSVQTVALVPLYLHAIGPRLYGAWLGSGDILLWMQAFDLGLPNLMTQRIGVAHGRGDSKSATEYFASGMLVMAGIALLLGAAAILASPRIPGLMGVTGLEARTLEACFTVSAVAAAVNLMTNGIVGYSRGIQDTRVLNLLTVVAGLAGFAVSLGSVLAGGGLWAVALGLVTRHLVMFAGSVAYAFSRLRTEPPRSVRPRKVMLREFLTVLPVTALGGIGYAAMNQSETAIVAILIRPEVATVFSLTRKALEIGRGFTDTIAFATYGSFAHLTASDQRHRVLQVHGEVMALRRSVAVAAATAYMAVNASLVAVWVGAAGYAGPWLTILLALQFVVVGDSFLANYLYRAMGPVMRGSVALLAEGVIRVLLMVALVQGMGIAGVPVAGVVTAASFLLLTQRWTLQSAPEEAEPYPRTQPGVWGSRAVILALGAIACVFVQWNSWTFVVVGGGTTFAVAAGVQLLMDPLLGNVRASIRSRVARAST